MAFEQRLVQNQSQKLILSPQIKQYIKLLQLPLIELQNSVEQEIAENPALEEALSSTPETDADEEPQTETKTEELDFQETFDKLEHLDEEMRSSLYSEYDSRLQSIDDLEKKHNYRESVLNKTESLSEYLLWQLQFVDLQPQGKEIAEHIIGNIDSHGYLNASVDEIAQALSTEASHVEEILGLIQTFDPSGVGARSLQECLLIQLINKEGDRELIKTACTIVEDHFKALEKKEYARIAKQLSISEAKAKSACELITTLEPKPGRLFYPDEPTVITPDASVYPADDPRDGYVIEIHDERVPQLRINRKYMQMIKDKSLDAKTKEYLKSKINAAFWFIKAIEQRRSTLREITEKIVIVQRDFFERGFAFLQPLRLKDIANDIGIHESTVSRAISGKFINTPQGTIPYKQFFSNKMETEDGGFESQTSIMEKIKFLVENEPTTKPHSDAKLVQLLQGRGIKIARRTVAKYREMLRILPSHMRKNK
jgi:RNA polymerase sigma-54 factor